MNQHAPFAVQVELTEGCNLRCSFCGLNGIRGKENNFKFLTPADAETVAERISEAGWNSRIEFAMHGEPSMNPDFVEIVRTFRSVLPKSHLMMTSNGAGFLKNPTETVDAVLQYLNVLAMDAYEGVSIVPRLVERYQGTHQPAYYPQLKEANPHKRRAIGDHDWVVVQDIKTATKGTHSVLNNHCGCGSPKNDNAAGKRCAKPFRELSIRWDGNVALCCNDWRGYYKCGNVLKQSLEEIWQGPRFVAARRKLYHGMRDFGPCQGCDALSYRPGLLPDHLGQESLPEPDAKDLAVITKALGGQPYTAPVLRPWETR